MRRVGSIQLVPGLIVPAQAGVNRFGLADHGLIRFEKHIDGDYLAGSGWFVLALVVLSRSLMSQTHEYKSEQNIA